MDDKIELEVLTPDVTEVICSINCGSKCCNFRLSQHYVPIEIIDYGNLSRLNLQKFVSFYHSVELPQLLSKPSGNCVFLDELSKKCMIYEFRPAACRIYPYREEADEVEDVPDWCELLHRSSEQLKETRLIRSQMINERVYQMQNKIEYDPLMEYLKLENSTQIFQLPSLTEFKEIGSNVSYWKLESTDKIHIASLLQITEEYEKTYFSGVGNKDHKDHPMFPYDLFEKNWILITILVYDDSCEIIGTIAGILRQDETIVVPYLEKFPPEYDDYDRLMRLISATKDLEKHMIRGAIVPDNFELIVKSRIANAEPISFESQ